MTHQEIDTPPTDQESPPVGLISNNRPNRYAWSKRKGANGERELVHQLREYGFECRRGLSQSRGGGAEEPDIVGMRIRGVEIHVEVKRTKRRPPMVAGYEQAARDAWKAKKGQLPLAIGRADAHPWMVMLTLDDFVRLIRRVEALEVVPSADDDGLSFELSNDVEGIDGPGTEASEG